ncbi:hypothetical protein SAMN06269301_3019 [Geobacter sp. DSM 9736]|nr:hypothetical protein SAMN06269301_3019 [Geobacter sp. DSM 9736]
MYGLLLSFVLPPESLPDPPPASQRYNCKLSWKDAILPALSPIGKVPWKQPRPTNLACSAGT